MKRALDVMRRAVGLSRSSAAAVVARPGRRGAADMPVRPARRGPADRAAPGMAIPAVLALLASVASLMLAYGLLATTNWLAARNLREGLHAWTRAESATALAMEQLGAAHARHGALPDAYELPPGAFDDVDVVYVAQDEHRAQLEVVASAGKAASRRILEVDMTRN